MPTASPHRNEVGDPLGTLTEAFRRSIVAQCGDQYADVDPMIRPSQRSEYGDYQANFAMALAKRVGEKPRALAERIAAGVDRADIAEPLEVAGPGFINIRLQPAALAGMLEAMDEPGLGVPRPSDPPTRVAIDLCGVNVAKQMHVGHLRSTIIGDALARVLERLGCEVHRENHLGDWGLPIAMVLDHLLQAGVDLDALELAELDRAYRDAQLACRADHKGLELALSLQAGPHRILELEAQNAGATEALESAKATLIKLQQGDPELVRDWRKLIECTLSALDEAVGLLNVKLTRENNRSESFYRDRLATVVDAFVRADVAREDDGALVVRFPDRERPMLIRKSDGGFLYATTDLAAIGYRIEHLKVERIIYVVDARQRDHFRDLFDATGLIKWDRRADGTTVELVHVPFGSVLGPHGKPLKTRAGENVTLKALLEEAIDRGVREVAQRAEDAAAPTHGLPLRELSAIGAQVGIGAIKYADLSNDLVRDYEFDFDRMIAFDGNTGPYIQYAHARVCSIFGKAGVDPAAIREHPLLIREPAEKQLALLLHGYGEVVADVGRTLEPHRLCAALYQLANAYSAFYNQCPVLKGTDPATRNSRLRLCDLTRRVLEDGLGLLGIEAPTRM